VDALLVDTLRKEVTIASLQLRRLTFYDEIIINLESTFFIEDKDLCTMRPCNSVISLTTIKALCLGLAIS
jgi:hypothetical protein